MGYILLQRNRWCFPHHRFPSFCMHSVCRYSITWSRTYDVVFTMMCEELQQFKLFVLYITDRHLDALSLQVRCKEPVQCVPTRLVCLDRVPNISKLQFGLLR